MTKKYTIKPVTAVHIGTGEELSFLDYRVPPVTEEKPAVYEKFSSDRILQRLADDKKAMDTFDNANKSKDMNEILDFFQRNCKAEDIEYSCDITGDFHKIYKENINKDAYENAALVFQMYRSEGLWTPVIPGSSLKGAMRTALLNWYLNKLPPDDKKEGIETLNNEKNLDNFNERIQRRLLEIKSEKPDPKKDPLRAVSISDCSFGGDGCQMVGRLYNVNKKLEALDLQIQAEVIRGELMDGKAVSELNISINDKLQNSKAVYGKDKDLYQFKKITFKDLQDSCNYFYWREFEKEYNEFYRYSNDEYIKQIITLKEKLEKAKDIPGQFIIRVGRWSQVEFVTYENDFRRPKTKKGKDGKPLHGNTRTLFDYDSYYFPMGWCILSEVE